MAILFLEHLHGSTLNQSRTLALAALVVTALASPTTLAASESLCLEAVKQQRFERLTTVCLDLPHRNRLEKMRLLMSGNFKHYLGTIDRPTEAFELLKEQASTHDADAQYMYAQLFETVHTASAENWTRHPGNREGVSLAEYNDLVKRESGDWLNRAAENGHALALIEVAETMLLNSYTSEDVNLREALSIAKRANESNPTLAANLIARLKKRISEY